MAKVFATPAEGVLVRKPDGKPLAAAGEPVERDSFWLRRERDGDVKLTDVPPEADSTASTSADAGAGSAAKSSNEVSDAAPGTTTADSTTNKKVKGE